MAHIIDIILVAGVLGLTVMAVAKYFFDLAKTPEGDSINCSGCNSGCHTDIPENPSLGLLRKIK